jgi:hypothetical protein
MRNPLRVRESLLLAGVLGLLLLMLFGPFVAQAPDYHGFADQRVRWSLPYAADVLSNLPFALVAAAIGWRLRRAGPGLAPAERMLAWLACVGLALTALASSWYHLSPDDAGLAVDRMGMTVAFAGLLGLAACRVSGRAGLALGLFVLLAAPVAVQVWATTGNLLPWAALQGGGLVLLLALAALPSPGALPVRWGLVLAAYVVAKLFELGDHAVWHATGEWVSGHTIKHLVAAAAAWPVAAALGRGDSARHNGTELPARAA